LAEVIPLISSQTQTGGAECKVELNIFNGDPYDVVMQRLAADNRQHVWTVESQYSGTGPLNALWCSLSS